MQGFLSAGPDRLSIILERHYSIRNDWFVFQSARQVQLISKVWKGEEEDLTESER
jgi:hypothetical protein